VRKSESNTKCGVAPGNSGVGGVWAAAPRRQPGLRTDAFAGFRLRSGGFRDVGDDVASAIEDTIERRVERWQLGEEGDYGGPEKPPSDEPPPISG
jgi:hypothetical protein